MNKVFAIIGPPASGKSSIVKKLLKDYGIPALVSHTTRLPKADEQHGVEYYFVDKNEFAKMNLFEKVSHADHFYGLSKDEVTSKVNQYPVSIVDIDLTGYNQLKKMLGERLESIYNLVDKDAIIDRYLVQGENPDEIKRRIEYAEEQGEFNNWQIADHVIKNTGSLDTVVRQVLAIMDLVVPKRAG